VNKHEIKGNWKQLRGRAKEAWGEPTDDDLDRIDGRRQVLVGKIQERYGKGLDAAEEEVDTWIESLDGTSRTR
jgi:uncharacterized protein YjbJ (UPF0337 family)